jgi:hypothetical protein
MAKNNISQVTEVGNLPIRVLAKDLLLFFINTNPTFNKEVFDQVNYHGLRRGVIYDNRQERITDVAMLINENQIGIVEPYLAFLWTWCHLIFISFRKRNVNGYNDSDIELNRAGSAFRYGLSLFTDWSFWDLNLPNPEHYDLSVDPYIEEANGLFLNAGKFFLCHEYTHFYFGHPSITNYIPREELIEEEFLADDYACQIILDGVGNITEETNSVYLGIVLGIGSILFLSDTFSGGDGHPDTDERIIRVLNRVCQDENDDLWRFATVMFNIWALIKGKAININHEDNNNKSQLLSFIDTLK